MLKKIVLLAVGVILLSYCGVSSAQTSWIIPYHESHHTGEEDAKIYLSINYDNLSTTVRDDIGGISGDLHYDPSRLSCPRIEPADSGKFATGFLLEPGVYRFCIFASPMGDLITRYGANSYSPDTAHVYFEVNDSLAGPTQITFTAAKASKLNRESHGDITISPITLYLNYNAVNSWSLYE